LKLIIPNPVFFAKYSKLPPKQLINGQKELDTLIFPASFSGRREGRGGKCCLPLVVFIPVV
jgi:hypothetical protein